MLAREGQQILYDAAGATRFAVDRLRRRALIGREALLGEEQLGERGDTGQRVVELVRYAGNELPDRRHFLRLDELLLQHLLVGDVADETEHFLILLRRRVRDRDRAD